MVLGQSHRGSQGFKSGDCEPQGAQGERSQAFQQGSFMKWAFRISAMPDSQGFRSEDAEPQGAQTKQPQRHARGEGSFEK